MCDFGIEITLCAMVSIIPWLSKLRYLSEKKNYFQEKEFIARSRLTVMCCCSSP